MKLSTKLIMKKPSIQLSDISTEIDAINGNVFNLKQFAKTVIMAAQKGDVTTEQLLTIIKIIRVEESINNLETEF